MVDVELVNEKNKQLVLETLESDVVRHVFAVYDLQKDPQHTRTYAAFMNGNLQGYILIYTATDVPSVILECEENVAEKLLEHAPLNNFIAHAPPNLLRYALSPPSVLDVNCRIHCHPNTFLVLILWSPIV